MTIKQALEYGISVLREKNIEEPILKAKIVLSTSINKTKEYLIANDSYMLNENELKRYKQSIKKLSNNEPLQYITGNKEFMKLNFFVTNDVLIPRQDTEVLVEETIEILKGIRRPRVLDLCTGSGVIGISIAKYIDEVKVLATDISTDAIRIANKNCNENKANKKLTFLQSDLFEKISLEDKFNLIVSNPPYIETEVINTLSQEVQKEPRIALDGGKDGLNIYRIIVSQAYKYLEKERIFVLRNRAQSKR